MSCSSPVPARSQLGRINRPLIAFVLAWLLTPPLTLGIEILLWPVLRALIPPNNDGTGAIMLPFFGIVTGLLAGGVAAIIVTRRGKKDLATMKADPSSTGPDY